MSYSNTEHKDVMTCVTLIQDDYVAVVVELKAACKALGQADADCQIGSAP